jgi:2-hydroxycyclohexanecarboxyl-CoA dehydrogenase
LFTPTRQSDTVAVVTGGARGIGRAVAIALARSGAYIIVADIDGSGARETAALIERAGFHARTALLDVADDASIARFHADVIDTEGRCDVLVNNAGWGEVQAFIDSSRALWDRIVAVNFTGVIAVTRSFLPDMVAQGAGCIVNVVSDAGRVGSSGETVLAGAKGGVIAFTKSLAREVARYGICCNCVSPGPTDTSAFRDIPQHLKDALIRGIPLHRIASPDDVANAVSFFASPDSSYITGQTLSVSGGLTMSD